MAKNLHMTHLEELMFNEGIEGTRRAIYFLIDLRDMLSGHVSSPVSLTTKWDGAPAVFAGIDPRDGKFFVAKKGVFNKTPKLYKTQADINADLSGDLKKKFTIALEEFSKLGIKSGVIQGDLMYAKGDVGMQKIDGEANYTFQPNTILYAIPVRSRLGAQIKKSKIGVVWHTSYSGRSLESMSASFGGNIVSKLNNVSSVWQINATYEDVSGSANLTLAETERLNSLVSEMGKIFSSVKGDGIREIQSNEVLRSRIMNYNNQLVREGIPFPDPEKHIVGLYNYLQALYKKDAESKKTEVGKKSSRTRRDDIMKTLFGYQNDLVKMFKIMNLMVEAKQIIIDKLNKTTSMSTFLKTSNGLKVTNQEGFVAIDHIGNAVKLVDRLTFSRANFSPNILKGWN